MKAKTILIALCCTLGLATTSVMAKGNGPKFGKILRQLDLTEEQKTQINDLIEAQKEAGQAQREAMSSVREAKQAEMKALMTAESFDESAVSLFIDEKAAHKKARELEKMRTFHSMMQLLTTEQQEEFLTLLEEQREKRNKRKGKNRGGSLS